MQETLIHDQPNEPLVNYLRVHRRTAGLTQHELGMVLGYADDGAVARHERFRSVPPFLMALSYEIVFKVPVNQLFPGLSQTIELGIETRLAELESRLRESEALSSRLAATTRKLEWLSERRSSGYK